MKCCDIISFLFIVALISGCASADVMLMDPSKSYPPTENVQIILEEPTRAHIIIAIVEGDGTQYNNQSQVVRAMQKKAAKIGANAIILMNTESQYVPHHNTCKSVFSRATNYNRWWQKVQDESFSYQVHRVNCYYDMLIGEN